MNVSDYVLNDIDECIIDVPCCDNCGEVLDVVWPDDVNWPAGRTVAYCHKCKFSYNVRFPQLETGG